MNIEELDITRLPQHVAIIMDGNGRWAQRLGQERIYGHQHSITALRQAIETAKELNLKYLTIYAFSTENWNRRKEEVDGLMTLMAKAIKEQFHVMQENKIGLKVIGDLSRVPQDTLSSLNKAIKALSGNREHTLVIALSYSSRWELTNAMRRMAEEVEKGTLSPSQIDDACIERHLATAGIPDPDLLIRTGGEQRISNFLLWQMAYTEFYFTDLLWPDFRREHFLEAVADYQHRQRRFGKSGDQVENQQK